MNYDFESYLSRKGTGSYKWARLENLDEKILPFDAADMEFRTAPEIIARLEELARFGQWGYTMPTERYKQAVVDWMKNHHNYEIKPEWIVNTFGIVPSIHTAVKTFTNPGDKVIVQPPVYGPFYAAITSYDRVVSKNNLIEKDGHYYIDFEDLEEKAKTAKMMIFCSPHNPVGRVWTREETLRIVEICKKHDVFLYSDENHQDLVMKPHVQTPVLSLGIDYDKIIAGTSAAKTFSLASLSCSNIIIPNDEIRNKFFAAIMKDGYYFMNVFGVNATEAAYTKGEPWMNELLEYIQGNFDFFKSYLKEKMPDAYVYPLEGTYLIWIDFRKYFGTDSAAIADFMNESIAIIDNGTDFGPEGAGFARFAIATPRWAIKDVIDRMHNTAKKRGLV